MSKDKGQTGENVQQKLDKGLITLNFKKPKHTQMWQGGIPQHTRKNTPQKHIKDSYKKKNLK